MVKRSPSFVGVKKNIFLSDLFSDEGLLIPWEVASVKFSMTNFFKWMQIANSIPNKWKEIVQGTRNVEECCFDIHINKGNKMIPLKSLDSKCFYSTFIDKIFERLNQLNSSTKYNLFI